MRMEVVSIISKVQVSAEEDVEAVEKQRRATAPMSYTHAEAAAMAGAGQGAAEAPEQGAVEEPAKKPFIRPDRKIGRNEPCPCGSGKKFKQCHGKIG